MAPKITVTVLQTNPTARWLVSIKTGTGPLSTRHLKHETTKSTSFPNPCRRHSRSFHTRHLPALVSDSQKHEKKEILCTAPKATVLQLEEHVDNTEKQLCYQNHEAVKEAPSNINLGYTTSAERSFRRSNLTSSRDASFLPPIAQQHGRSSRKSHLKNDVLLYLSYRICRRLNRVKQ